MRYVPSEITGVKWEPRVCAEGMSSVLNLGVLAEKWHKIKRHSPAATHTLKAEPANTKEQGTWSVASQHDCTDTDILAELACTPFLL